MQKNPDFKTTLYPFSLSFSLNKPGKYICQRNFQEYISVSSCQALYLHPGQKCLLSFPIKSSQAFKVQVVCHLLQEAIHVQPRKWTSELPQMFTHWAPYRYSVIFFLVLVALPSIVYLTFYIPQLKVPFVGQVQLYKDTREGTNKHLLNLSVTSKMLSKAVIKRRQMFNTAFVGVDVQRNLP